MWDKSIKIVAGFNTGVLNTVDSAGYPVSQRCTMTADASNRAFRFEAKAGIELVRGPASVLFHSFNDHLWNLKGHVLKGHLEHDSQGWFFRPTKVIPEVNAIQEFMRMLRSAREYLKKRKLERPSIPWRVINEAKDDEVRKAGSR